MEAYATREAKLKLKVLLTLKDHHRPKITSDRCAQLQKLGMEKIHMPLINKEDMWKIFPIEGKYEMAK